MFQSTRPRGARRVTVVDEDGDEMFQSTRPRGARPDEDSAQGGSWPVSIHAPAWGATSYIVPFCKKNVPVSIHAPAWGATRMLRTSARGLPSFNPRARVGRDSRSWLARRRMRCFNPRARVGRDARPRGQTSDPSRFNPRARVGRDASSGLCRPPEPCFNPRARVGRDAIPCSMTP